MISNKYQVLAGYSLIHGIIDLVSVTMVLGSVIWAGLSASTAIMLVIAYNLTAFALQAPIGFLIDYLKTPKEGALVGCLLLLLSLALYMNPVLVVMLAGLGNAFFHVGGGSISLNIKKTKALYPGIFVAPGALGLSLGVILGYSGSIPFLWLLALLLISIIFIVFSKTPEISYKKSSKVKEKINYFYLVIAFLLLSVSIRSLYGLSAVFTWKSEMFWLISLTTAIVLGKALGGLIADNLGWRKTAVLALAISAPLLAFFQDQPILAITGAFFFQMTMPITLTAVSNMMPGKSASAFGLTVLALAVGTVPVYLFSKSILANQYLVFLVILVSLFFIVISFKFLKPYFKKDLNIKF
ncbi:MAG: hypothetical protein K9M44_02270 [Candidatus Pacebacteria bacterium]|nr:hypothetical protein [Candidatus Paceibacterota bacterium]